jgi:hypothetical protein
MTPWARVAPGLWVLKSSILHINDDLRMWRRMRAEERERVREFVCVCVCIPQVGDVSGLLAWVERKRERESICRRLVTLAVCSQGLPGIGGPRGLQGGWTVIDATKKCTELGKIYIYYAYTYTYTYTHTYTYTYTHTYTYTYTYTCKLCIHIQRSGRS